MVPADAPKESPPKPAPGPAPAAAAAPAPPPAGADHAPPLSPEEQMEKFAEELKEQDWGHQPC